MAKKANKNKEQFPQVEETISKTQQYIENNKKRLGYILSVLIVLVAIYPMYQGFYLAPLEEDAKNDMYMAEIYFEKDSFLLSLVGDGQFAGFLDIIDQYGSSKSANMANYYAGLCYWHMSDFDFNERIIPLYSSTLKESSYSDNKYENVIEYLSDFSSDDYIISSLALGGIGDAYLELEDNDMALKYYKKAAENSDNDFTTPRFLMKQAMIHELNNDFESATTVYKEIKDNYNLSREAQNIEKYISRNANR